MTELEYEKAARGPVYPLAGEYAWGSTRVVSALVGGGPLGQSQSFFFLDVVGAGLGDLWVRGRTSGDKRGLW